MINSALDKRAAILNRIPKRSVKSLAIPRPIRNNENNSTSSVSGFAPVEITDLPDKESNQIEVFFPSGVQVVLSGSQSMSSLTTLLKQGF